MRERFNYKNASLSLSLCQENEESSGIFPELSIANRKVCITLVSAYPGRLRKVPDQEHALQKSSGDI
jgi:hypothetical protein